MKEREGRKTSVRLDNLEKTPDVEQMTKLIELKDLRTISAFYWNKLFHKFTCKHETNNLKTIIFYSNKKNMIRGSPCGSDLRLLLSKTNPMDRIKIQLNNRIQHFLNRFSEVLHTLIGRWFNQKHIPFWY